MKKGLLLLIVALMAIGCGSSKKVYRINPETQTDLSGNWNDTDARLVAEEMVKDCLSRPWLTNYVKESGQDPVVTVGTIRNKSDEHIDVEVFTTDFERELINSGQVRFVAAKDYRQEIREERFDQQEFASPETMKKIRNETGADFILMGSVKTINDEAGGTLVKYYQTDLEMINNETMEKVWIGTKKIKKEISKSKTKW